MPPPSGRRRALTRPERVAGLLALVLGGLHLLLLPDTGTDTAAQLARASFAREAPLTPVDLSWFGGVHPYGYSLLAPAVMALVGVGTAGLLSAVGMAVLLARLLRDSLRPMHAAVASALFGVANDVTGRTTFGLGAVAALAALLCLPRPRRAAALAVLTALLSPVAAAFLGFAAAVLVLRRRPGGWTLGLAASVPVVVLSALFPGGGIQPFSIGGAVPAILVAVGLAVLVDHPLVRTGALLYVPAVLLFALHTDPFGSNVLRLSLLLPLPLLLAWSRRSTAALLVGTVGFLLWQGNPPRSDLRGGGQGPPVAALTRELVELGAQRVEVVPARDHREAYVVAERVPLARGWSRQLDVERNQLFYKGRLEPATYLAWLRDRGVDHVAVPRRTVLDYGSNREARLLRQPVAGLNRVWADLDWVVFEVVDAQPIADAQVLSSTRTELVVRAEAAGDVRVRVRWSRWLSVRGDAACARPDAGTETVLRFTSPGTVTLTSSLRPRGHC